MTLDKVSINDLGKAKKITITKDKTTIVAFEDTKDLVKERVEKLKREVDITEGMSFDRGYSSPYFVTDQARQVLENPKILITDQKISTLVDLVPILEEIQKSGSPFLIPVSYTHLTLPTKVSV